MAAAEPAVEATAVEDPDQPEPIMNVPAPGAELAIVEQSAGAIIRAEQPDEILAKAGQIATALAALIEQQGLAVNVGGRKKHVEVGGWQALGTMLGALGGQPLHAETVWTRKVVDQDGQAIRTRYTAEVRRFYKKNEGGGLRETTTYEVDGFDWEAKVEIRTPDGTIVGSAEAMVSRTEETWNRRDDFALRSMAETRAESRAYRRACGWIVNLAGYNPTPAEEMGHTPGADSVPGWICPATTEMKKAAIDWVAVLLERLGANGESREKAIGLLKEIAEIAGGELPDVAAKMAIRIGQLAEKTSPATTAPDDASPPPAEATADDQPPAGTIWVEGIAEDKRPADATVVDIDRARELCQCPGGFDDAEIRGGNFADDCPIANHGIPF